MPCPPRHRPRPKRSPGDLLLLLLLLRTKRIPGEDPQLQPLPLTRGNHLVPNQLLPLTLGQHQQDPQLSLCPKMWTLGLLLSHLLLQQNLLWILGDQHLQTNLSLLLLNQVPLCHLSTAVPRVLISLSPSTRVGHQANKAQPGKPRSPSWAPTLPW